MLDEVVLIPGVELCQHADGFTIVYGSECLGTLLWKERMETSSFLSTKLVADWSNIRASLQNPLCPPLQHSCQGIFCRFSHPARRGGLLEHIPQDP